MQEYFGEFIGTVIIIVLGVGLTASVNLNKAYGKNSGWLYICFGWGLSVAFGVYVSSFLGAAGHLNPAVTLSSAAFGLFPASKVLGYLVAQFIGAFLGAVIIAIHYYPHFKETTPEEGNTVGVFASGGAIPNKLFNFLGEFIATFFFVYIMLNLGDFTDGLKPLIVGLVITSVGLALGSTTGYALNPFRDFAPRLAYAILPIPNKSDANMAYAWVPIVGPICGAMLATLIFSIF
ncbi:MIP/aquaporin family protein [Vagococcus intermedius]|uniref:Aquaporin family protein n=1 Tax=Vagococcus intermedius TaxID=2991418 RepID=A0AAF0CT43_9ENTE|nr:MIP/aquaporin family protein [Vagococcus intermedius]WEG72504.1 aquaporin family protein [Vagococcus intermedius]WEG74591.1 aquaporin family protein [Vagococcus intermedius]